MKAELLKDFYLLRRWFGALLILTLILFIAEAITGNSFVSDIYISCITPTLILVDIRMGRNEYSKFLPRKKCAYAISKYIIGAALGILVPAIKTMVYLLTYAIRKEPLNLTTERLILSAAIDIIAITGFSAINIPTVMAFGLSGFGMFVFAASAVLMTPIYAWQAWVIGKNCTLSSEKALIYAAVFLLIAAAIYAASIAISIRQSEKYLQPKTVSKFI